MRATSLGMTPPSCDAPLAQQPLAVTLSGTTSQQGDIHPHRIRNGKLDPSPMVDKSGIAEVWDNLGATLPCTIPHQDEIHLHHIKSGKMNLSPRLDRSGILEVWGDAHGCDTPWRDAPLREWYRKSVEATAKRLVSPAVGIVSSTVARLAHWTKRCPTYGQGNMALIKGKLSNKGG
ncbi:unnamed protein product [Ilex paraguariensis]|uniref:Uncharacterized protein n=1 Tax=Ilex paraguariensis TaxID=185542 RepID=A0ABC8UUX7_9AQUA